MKAVVGGALFGSALLFSGCTTEVIEEAPETSPTTTSPAPSEQHGGGQGHGPAGSPAPGPAPGPAQTTVPMMPNPNGDGSMVPCEGTICTNPNHGAGDDPAENGGLMEDPDGSGDLVPCEGTICTNPNHGAGDGDGDAPPEPGQTEMQGPDGTEDGTEG